MTIADIASFTAAVVFCASGLATPAVWQSSLTLLALSGCTGSSGRMSADDTIGQVSNNLQKQRKEKPSYDERSSTGKAGCGKSAGPV